ncbi:unnamed protein product, partial [Notodromas monacha]
MRPRDDVVVGLFFFLTSLSTVSASSSESTASRRRTSSLTCEVCMGDCSSNKRDSMIEECPPAFPDSCAAVYNRNGEL